MGRKDIAGCSNGTPIPSTRYLRHSHTVTGNWTNGEESGTYSTTNIWTVDRWTGVETSEVGNRTYTGTESTAGLFQEGPDYTAEVVEDSNTRYRLVRRDLRNSFYAMAGTETTLDVFDEPTAWGDFMAACDALYSNGSNQIITLLREQTLINPSRVFEFNFGLTYGANEAMVIMQVYNIGPYASRMTNLEYSVIHPFPGSLGIPSHVGHAAAVVVSAGTHHIRRSFIDPCDSREFGVTDTAEHYPLGIVELVANIQEVKELLI